MRSERILLFHRNQKRYPSILAQLSSDLDKVNSQIDMIITTQKDWLELEDALLYMPYEKPSETIKVKLEGRSLGELLGTDKPAIQVIKEPQEGFASITFRAKPVVAGVEVLEARLKANG